MTQDVPQLDAAGSVGVRGRLVGRIIEFEVDRRGRPLRQWSVVGFFTFLFFALKFWRKGYGSPWATAYQLFGPQLVVKRIVEDNIRFPNGATTQGLNHALDVTFRAQTATATWYVGIINNSAFSAVAAADTAASHAGWTEWTGYNESVRQTWSPAAAAAGSVANSSAMTFTNNSGSSVTIRGVAVWSVSTKGASTGILWATAIESSGRTLSNTQAFQVIYQVDFTPTS